MHDVLTLSDLGTEHIGKQFYIGRNPRRLYQANTVVYLEYAEPHGLPTWKFLWSGMIQELFGEHWYLLPTYEVPHECEECTPKGDPQAPSAESLFERVLEDSL